jgi:broad specificity phosphatase PhoE
VVRRDERCRAADGCVVVAYTRARETTRLILESAGIAADRLAWQGDERLREKEFGVLDRLTKFGIEQKYPELSEQRRDVGKFYFRLPGGESLCDVQLRLRSLLDSIVREHRHERVLIISHQVIVNCFRYVLDRLGEQAILAIDRSSDVPNCSVTSYEFDAMRGKNGKLVPRLVNSSHRCEMPARRSPPRPIS